MLACQQAIADDRVLVPSCEPAGLANPTAFGNMSQDRDDLFFRQLRPEQRRALAFGKTRFTARTIEHPSLLVGSIAVTHTQVAGIPFTMISTLRMVTKKHREVLQL